jgi:cytochrome c oxidase assembly protein subunit 15
MQNAPRAVKTGVAAWLFACAFAVLMMALIGAVTRLTESGLSIVEWKPVAGALWPSDWNAEFDLYKKTPQYKKVNHGMTLEEFKGIYFWEWVHRFWGRAVGVIFALPFFIFLLAGKLPRRSLPGFAAILALGGAQGFMGWFMVKSGLVDQPAVSHYRLAAHLLLAALIYALLFRKALRFGVPAEKDAAKMARFRRRLIIALGLVAVTMTWGAFVAGLRAGLLYNTFPMMDSHWIPPELAAHRPIWRAFFEEPATVQFTHRCLAAATFIWIILTVRKTETFHPPRRLRRLFHALAFMVLLQACLGIMTLLSHVQIALAAAHQAGAFVLLALLVWLLHEIPPVPYSKA